MGGWEARAKSWCARLRPESGAGIELLTAVAGIPSGDDFVSSGIAGDSSENKEP